MAYDGQIRILKAMSISRGIGNCSFVDSASVRSLGVITPAGLSDPVGLKIREARILPMQWLAKTSPQTPQIDAWLRSAFESFNVSSSSGIGIGTGSSLFLPKLIQKNLDALLFKKGSLDKPTPNRFTLGVDAAHAICGFIKLDLEEYSTQQHRFLSDSVRGGGEKEMVEVEPGDGRQKDLPSLGPGRSQAVPGRQDTSVPPDRSRADYLGRRTGFPDPREGHVEGDTSYIRGGRGHLNVSADCGL
jgi:hypothetical protein